MGRAKVARKSTFIDMAAMCDVTFLLLAFFIMTTKFKPDETVPIQTPSSVAQKPAPEKNAITLLLDKDGRAYMQFTDDIHEKLGEMVAYVNTHKSGGLSQAEIDVIAKQGIIATPVANLKQQTVTPKIELGKLPGIPVKDTANNEMSFWISAFNQVYLGDEHPPAFLLKGDNIAKFPEFKNILKALTDNNQNKFSMVTNQKQAPEGTDLWIRQMRGKAASAEASATN